MLYCYFKAVRGGAWDLGGVALTFGLGFMPMLLENIYTLNNLSLTCHSEGLEIGQGMRIGFGS